MSEKLCFLIVSLDFHIGNGDSPIEALHKAVENYAYVYHGKDDKTGLARAASCVLDSLNDSLKKVSGKVECD